MEEALMLQATVFSALDLRRTLISTTAKDAQHSPGLDNLTQLHLSQVMACRENNPLFTPCLSCEPQ